jgi:hypothetical protein
MKKTLLAGLATGLFFLISAGIAIAGDEAKNKTDNNNSKTTGLYDNVTILQEQINSLTERIEKLEQIDFANRFTDVGDGTIRDNDSGLIWLKDASCDNLPHTDHGIANWEYAIVAAVELTSGTCGLTDGSEEGDWRLPTKAEWAAFMSAVYWNPALVNTRGDAQWSEGDAFTGDPSQGYWSITEYESSSAWYADMTNGQMNIQSQLLSLMNVWPVRSPLCQ